MSRRTILGATVNGLWLRAAGAARRCAPAALIGHFWAPLNLTVRAAGSVVRSTLAVVSGLLIASPVCIGTESDYNLGVQAYRTRNYPEAAAQWKKTVARGNVDAMNNLGYLLYYGYGVTIGAMYVTRVDILSGHAMHADIQRSLKATLPSPTPGPSPTSPPPVPIIFVSPTPTSR